MHTGAEQDAGGRGLPRSTRTPLTQWQPRGPLSQLLLGRTLDSGPELVGCRQQARASPPHTSPESPQRPSVSAPPAQALGLASTPRVTLSDKCFLSHLNQGHEIRQSEQLDFYTEAEVRGHGPAWCP